MTRSTRRAALLSMLALLAACGGSTTRAPVEPAPTGTLALVLTPASLLVVPGASGSVGLALTRGGGFAGAVQLTAAGVPAGVSITFGSSTVAEGAISTSVSVSVAAGVAASSTPISITITATGGGITSPPTTLALRTA
jgi:hypothetical protein